MKNKKDIFFFEAGKYVVGDISNLFEEKLFKKIKGSLCKIKSKCGLNKQFNLYFFKGINRRFNDYIENNSYVIAENCLVVVPEELVKPGRLINCKRINAKSQFSVEYKNDNLGIVLYLKEMAAPGPFMMLVQENEAK